MRERAAMRLTRLSVAFAVVATIVAATVIARGAGTTPVTTSTSGPSHHPGQGGGTSADTSSTDGGAAGAQPNVASTAPDGGTAGTCQDPTLITNELIQAGGNDVAVKAFGRTEAKKESADDLTDLGESGEKDGLFIISLGPDGQPTAPIPTHVPEDATVVVVFYRPAVAGYSVDVSGCQPTTVRVQGSIAEVAKEAVAAFPGAPPPSPPTTLKPYATKLGRCSADSTVTLAVKVPAQGQFCAADSHNISFKTDPTYAITVGIGGSVSAGYFSEVGVTPGIGGAPGTVFERTSNASFDLAATVAWYPWRLNPYGDFGRRRFFIGTAVPLTWPPSSLNVLAGVALVPGLQLAAGVEFLRHVTVLDDGLHNGSVFNDDSSTLPTHQTWQGHAAFVLNVSLSTSLATSIIGH
jgi:hypothetical protein